MVNLISPYRIKYRGKTNEDFYLICDASFDPDSGNTESFLNKESVASNTYDGSRRNVHNYSYTDVMTVSITLIKKDYTEIETDENRKILAWLSGSNKVEELFVYHDDSEVVSYRLIGNIVNIEQYKNTTGTIIGYVITFENNAPYAYSPVKSTSIKLIGQELTDNLGKIKINYKTDVYEKNLYPRITVTLGESIYIPTEEDPSDVNFNMLDNTIYEYHYDVTNATTGKVTHKTTLYIKADGGARALNGVFATSMDKQTVDPEKDVGMYYLCNYDKCIYKGTTVKNADGTITGYGWEKILKVGVGFEIANTYFDGTVDTTSKSIVTNCHENEIITLDGTNKIISSSDTPGIRVFGDTFNWQWIYLVPGENNITISGVCDVLIEWVEPIKIGNL